MSRSGSVCRAVALGVALFAATAAPAAEFVIGAEPFAWQQVEKALSFDLCVDREEFSNLDTAGRIVFAVQTGQGGPKLDELRVRWAVRGQAGVLAQRDDPIGNGLLAIGFRAAGLAEGRYDVTAELIRAGQPMKKSGAFFRVVRAEPPPDRGRAPIVLPSGVPVRQGDFPLSTGVPFPKGALADPGRVRVVTADGRPVPCQTTVRSRWGHTQDASIRWLGVDFPARTSAAWWPDRGPSPYFLEFGPAVSPAPTPNALKIAEDEQAISVDAGAISFSVPRRGFNLFGNVRAAGRNAFDGAPNGGAYLVDHEGSVYRAANDSAPRVTIEESGPLRVTLRAEGWYVKDGAAGESLSYTLPTDRLCRFITRIEAYAGKPYVRVLHTWILTFDSFTVRLRDVGFALPLKARQAEFGIEDTEPLRQDVTAGGVRLVQHLPHRFDIEDDARPLAQGKHSAGWMIADTGQGLVGVSLRDAWQRFPKEFEAAPDAVRLHVWPAHGRDHPDIRQTDHAQIHKLWFAHQGRELNLRMPWDYYFAVSRIVGEPAQGVYSGPGLVLAGVHSSAMGVAITSDFLVHFADTSGVGEVRDTAQAFVARPHALPDPEWLCASGVIGPVQPYTPKMAVFEEVIENLAKGYWETQDATDQYGMWLYRTWHHTRYLGEGRFELYRLYNATHHYEAYMPWLLYARSGDPFYFRQGCANARLLSDVQMIHYDDPKYPHVEFHFRQGRLVGSTRHTNGFNTWGGDHAVLAHLTCYNSLILAHYLTGDLRLREVVVDEWQKTLLTERAKPELAKASRLHEGRDPNNSLGELIDLYQLTWHPALPAAMAPLVPSYLKNMYDWGYVHQNVAMFLRNSQAAAQMIEGCREYARKAGQPSNEHGLWSTHAPHGVLSMAAVLDSKADFHVAAFWAADIIGRKHWALLARRQTPSAVTFCTVPDYLIHLPRVMRVIARRADEMTLEKLSTQQPFPSGDMKLRGWTRCVLREDEDRDFVVSIIGKVGQQGAPVLILGQDGKKVAEATVPEGSYLDKPFQVKVPKDGRTGQYVVFLKLRDGKDNVMAPLTDLPGEVYHVAYWWQFSQTRFFTRSRGETPETLTIQPHVSGGQILDFTNQEALASTAKGEKLTARVGPEGVLVEMRARYVHPENPVILSVSPSRWFVPDGVCLKLSPP